MTAMRRLREDDAATTPSRVTRAAEIGSALETLSVSPITGITGVVVSAGPDFSSRRPDTADPRTFTADVAISVTLTLTVTATAKDGWEEEVTYHDDPDAD